MNMSENIKKTINEKEIETQKYWEEHDIFKKSISTPAGNSPESDYSFYDGPPFATGLPHHGHILAGTIKDAIPRYQTMNGKSVRRVWGWDCHGLPIENLIEKEAGLNSKKEIEEYGIGKFTDACSDSVLRYDKEWKEIVPRLGRWVDMSNAYKTMDWTYTESAWWAWAELYKKGLAYEGHKIMFVCPRCETSLAQSEVAGEYQDITDMTVTAKFQLVDEPDTFILAWTTTPWTLPGNTALAVNKNIEYVKVKATPALFQNGEGLDVTPIYLILSKKIFLEKSTEDVPYTNKRILKEFVCEIVEEFTGEKLIGKSYLPPFNYFNNEAYLSKLENRENIWKVWHADFITDDAGTGIAHEAPAFGAEDMELAKANKIPIIKHVKMSGEFIEEVTDFQNLKVKSEGDSISTDIEIVKWLAHNGKLFSKEKIIHSYPTCWRCHTPLLNYATGSWFIDVPKIKDKLIEKNKSIDWTPEHIRDGRFGKWLEGAREWAVSRSRYWGAPLPIWKSEKSGEIFVAASLEDMGKRNVIQPKNKYFIMRHGEANSNVENRYDAGEDETNHLTAKGIAQIESVIGDIQKLNIDLILHSPVLRTRETLNTLNKNLNIATVEEADLREFDDRDKDAYEGLKRRTHGVIEKYEKECEGKNILIVTHLATARSLFEGYGVRHVNLGNAELRELVAYDLPRDTEGKLNLHRPHIDKIVLKDSEGGEMKRILDVFDCWYESGSMPFASIHYPFENKEVFDKNFPAELIAEGLDQTRGWFYSLINLGVGLFDKAPYKNVIVNGIINAKDGQKMSKSQKNYTDPMEVVEKYGADALRYALLSTPLVRGESVSFGDEYVDEASKKVVQRFENVVDFYALYTNSNVIASSESKNVLDQWMLARVSETLARVTLGFDSYKLDEAVRPLEDLIDDLSTWYLRRSRDRLKSNDSAEALSVMKFIVLEIVKMSAPVMPFLSERVYLSIDGARESVHLEAWSKFKYENKEVLDEMKTVREIVTSALLVRQTNNIKVRQPLAALYTNKKAGEEYMEIIKEELNVLEVVIDEARVELTSLDLVITPELKLAGDKRELQREIRDLRKEAGLTQNDFADLEIVSDKLHLIDDELKASVRIKNVAVGEVTRIV
jgi:isoleucyl-tRNA synthetase